MSTQDSSGVAATQASTYRNRFPAGPAQRIFSTRQLTLIFTAYSAATWTLLFGGYLPYVGTAEMGLLAYGVGYIVGLVPIVLSTAIISARYGIETLDAVKPTFGTRGFYVPLIISVLTLTTWGYLLTSMGAVSTGRALATLGGREDNLPLPALAVIGVGILLVCWFGATRGAAFFDRSARWASPALIVLSLAMFVILVAKFGFGGLWNQPVEEPLSGSQWLNFIYGFEWGFAAALAWWPTLGALSRFAQSPRVVMPSSIWGIGVIGGTAIAIPAAYASMKVGDPDPSTWIPAIAGDSLAVIGLAFILLANVTSVVMIFYVMSLQLGQLPYLRNLRQGILIMLLVLPGVWFATRPYFLLENVMTVLTYTGYAFAGIAAVTIVDFFVLRRSHIDVRAIFDEELGKQKYGYWGGVNWVALVIVGMAFWFETQWLLDPISLEYRGPFAIVGASIPTMLGAGLLYYLVMKYLVLPRGIGDFPGSQPDSAPERRRDATTA